MSVFLPQRSSVTAVVDAAEESVIDRLSDPERSLQANGAASHPDVTGVHAENRPWGIALAPLILMQSGARASCENIPPRKRSLKIVELL
jgi:hypothetical protein